jgi:hypothetical protein
MSCGRFHKVNNVFCFRILWMVPIYAVNAVSTAVVFTNVTSFITVTLYCALVFCSDNFTPAL